MEEVNYNDVRVWLARAEANAAKCFICRSITRVNPPASAELRKVRIAGVELSAEMQISHLARCVGRSAHSA
ncbi:MAG: hypothetical protein HYY17_11760 [Planctomycetes bacterium]|nr:hypothetical protein [Planctomycetota bacterium]